MFYTGNSGVLLEAKTVHSIDRICNKMKFWSFVQKDGFWIGISGIKDGPLHGKHWESNGKTGKADLYWHRGSDDVYWIRLQD